MSQLRYQQALVKALRDEMLRDASTFFIGEDVRESLRGISKGLAEELGPDRILDTPISEQAFTGFATGAALAGRRPIVEYQIPSLLFLAFEQIVNQAQKFRLMTGGQARVPVTYIVPGSGARLGLAAQHSDHPYTFFAHAGVKTVVPATAYDAYGLFVAAIRCDDPVVLFAPAAALARRDEVPDEPYVIELGKGRIHREGSDVTVVAVGHLVHQALDAASELADEVSVEVLDPRCIHPFDWKLLAESLAKTGRLVVYDDSSRTAGFAAEITATAAEEMNLVAPPRRVTRADVPVSFAVELELSVLPAKHQLIHAIRSVVGE
ncbi:MAG: alpha-ketoacid dehydrogenase subunit beta, partial [Actinomycetota bacterium]|nr:alpha-ketoacid dehydrogenase subunit beta [Actinomycetota bacterium]